MRNRFLAAFAGLAMLFGMSIVTSPATASVSQAVVQAPSKGGVDDQKGMPPSKAQLNAKSSCGSPSKCFSYVGVSQFVDNGPGTGANGVTVATSQHNSYINTTNDYHDLWELAIQNDGTTAPNGNIMEAGWTKDPAVCGQTTSPCLFAFHWINGVKSCYAPGCSWVDNPSWSVDMLDATAVTAAGASPTLFYDYKIKRASSVKCDGITTDGTPVQTTAYTGWFVYWGPIGSSQIIGCQPDYTWTNVGQSFTKIRLVQAFNEISGTDDRSCSDMGSGVFGVSTTPSAAQWVKGYTLESAPSPVVPDWTTMSPTISAGLSPNFYRINQNSATEHRVGGPGADVNGGTVTGSVGNC